MKNTLLAYLLIVGGLLLLVGCSPKVRTESPVAAPALPPFVFSAGLKIESLTLEDYAALNRDMSDILKRVGFVDCKGYLIPRLGIHGGTSPEVVIEGKSETNDAVEQMIEKEGIQSVANRLTVEFEKSRARRRDAQKKTAEQVSHSERP